jgi:hypothetical protein
MSGGKVSGVRCQGRRKTEDRRQKSEVRRKSEVNSALSLFVLTLTSDFGLSSVF